MIDKLRPSKMRSHKWAIKVAKYLASKSITPNQITLLGIAFAAFAMMGAMFWNMLPVVWIQVLLLLLIIVGVSGRLLCNLLNEMVALEKKEPIAANKLYDEMANCASDALIFIGLGYGLASSTPFAVLLGFCAALLAIATSYVRILGVSMGASSYYIGPMAKQHRMGMVVLGALWAIVGAIYGFSWNAWTLYAVLVLVILGAIWTCWLRIQKIDIDIKTEMVDGVVSKMPANKAHESTTQSEATQSDLSADATSFANSKS